MSLLDVRQPLAIMLDQVNDSELPANPETSKSPRGVRGFKLDTGNFTTWKVQGKVGGYTK